MGKFAPILAVAAMLLRSSAPVGAQANAAPGKPDTTPAVVIASPDASFAGSANRIAGYSAWDDDFLYLAFQVNKPTLNGKNTAPYSNPLEDDALLISFQTDGDRTTTKRTEKTVVVAISGMGGAQLYTGAEASPLFASFDEIGKQLEAIAKNEPDPDKQAQKRAVLLGRLLKFQVASKGALRSTGTAVAGYTVEIAIPWSDLGGKPAPDTKMGFHVAAQSTSQDSPALQVLSPKVKTADDLNNPSLWAEINFRNAPAAPKAETVIAARVLGAKPTIDGSLSDGEWPGLGGFEFGERAPTARNGVSLATTLAARTRAEYTPRAPHSVVPVVTNAQPLVMPERKAQKVAALTLAKYLFYQADLRQSEAEESVWKVNGQSALINHPLDGAGPWFSAVRADYHRRLLLEARRAGIDAILPVYAPAPNNLRLETRSLLALASALNSLRQSGQDYPQVGLFLNTNMFVDSSGAKLDLKETTGQASLYTAVRDFYRAIPAPFRLTIPLSAANGGRRACVVFLSSASAFKEMDASFVAYLRGRFAQDFDNSDLVLIGGSDFKAKAPLDGYFSETKDKGFQFEGDGTIKIASVGAGYDNSNADKGEPVRRSRKNGETYRADWTAALDKRPDWVFLDGWNDYTHGAAVAPTIEAGYGPSDLTRVYTRLFAGLSKRGAKFLWNDAPAALPVNSNALLNVRVQNTGTEGWSASGGQGLLAIGLAYRWMKAGQVAATGTATELPASVLAGQNLTATLAVNTPNLTPGDYVLEIGAAQSDKRGTVTTWLSNAEDGSLLQIPVKVTEKATDANALWAATVVSADVPMTPETGSVYEVRATLRNDGTATWRKAEGARVTLRLYRTQGTESVVVPSADATVMLDTDVAPGQIASVRLLLPLMDVTGKPLPISDPDSGLTYMLRWEVATDGKHTASGETTTVLASQAGGEIESAHGISFAPQTLHISDLDFGVRFTADGTPSSLPGQRRLPMRLSLQNNGPQTWKQDKVRVGYHWYYMDGTEFLWEDETTPLPQDVPPGGKLTDFLAYVTPPPYDGTYTLVWDVKIGDMWASTTEATRAFDQSVREVKVIGGKLTFADLTKLYNVDGISDEDDTTDGDFDGTGRTFPAALLPPFSDAPIVPATIWQPTKSSGPDSPRRISFRLGSKEPKANNFIACKGQRIDLGKSAAQCRVLHILAASSGQSIATNVKLIFQEPTRESEDLLAFIANRWDAPPAKPEQEAFTVQRIHTRNGAQSGTVGLYHYTITVREPRKLIALQLPNAPDVKIAALTLEK